MVHYKALALGIVTLCLASAVATAQQSNSSSGTTSGPAAGNNVNPSTGGQSAEGRSSTGDKASSTAGGAPGVAAKPGTESGAKPAGMKNFQQ